MTVASAPFTLATATALSTHARFVSVLPLAAFPPVS